MPFLPVCTPETERDPLRASRAARKPVMTCGALILLIAVLASVWNQSQTLLFLTWEATTSIPECEIAVIKNNKPSRYSTPGCKPHPTVCRGLCEIVGKHLANSRNHGMSSSGPWVWYYQSVADYYRCTGVKKVVEVGVAFGSQSNFHLKFLSDQLEEYHMVDPFMAGYDPNDPVTSGIFLQAAPNATPVDISVAWAQSMAKDLSEGMYLDEGMAQPGCKLRVHRLKSEAAAELLVTIASMQFS